MSPVRNDRACEQEALTYAYMLHALRADETAAAEAHVSSCPGCRQLMESLRPVVSSLADWPIDVARPPDSLWDRLSQRIGTASADTAGDSTARWSEPDWEDVAPGISCRILASDAERDRVTMLVRLAPGVEYPPHSHAGVEELHLLDGELWIQDRKLLPGDYNRSEPGTSDVRVWSETGCTCVLITSPSDRLG